MVLDPWHIVSTAEGRAGLRLLLLGSLPAEPVTLETIAAAALPLPLAPIQFSGEPEEVVPGTVIALSLAAAVPYPDGAELPLVTVALAVVHGDPPDQVIDWAPLAGPLLLSLADEAIDSTFDLCVGRQPT